jgi:hypothetical protein
MDRTRIRQANAGWQPAVISALLFTLFFFTPELHVQPVDGGAVPEGVDPAATGRKLSNPLGDVWALFTEFDVNTSNGNLTSGDQQVGSRVIFQPILPFPLSGSGGKQWRFITRPTIPFLFSQPIPFGRGLLDQKGGLGDIQVPMVISPSVNRWILGAGPTWLFPTATERAFGRQQWGVGPAVVVGHYSDKLILGVFPQYFFGIGSRPAGNTHDASYMNVLYFMYYNLPNAWQVGFSPTITYDRQASADNKWNMPIGVSVSKTTRVGHMITKFELGVEYSVVRQDAFGQRTTIKLSVIPVIPSLIRKPLFGAR